VTARISLLVSAGEASGDLAAAEVLHALARAGVAYEAYGLGGPALAAAGLAPAPGVPAAGALAVVGLWEAVSAVPAAVATVRALAGAAARRRPDAALLVDLPDTNALVAARLARLGVPVVRYGVPQVWAWRPGRARAVAATAAALAVTLPFEAPWWRAAGVGRVEFVGHPAVQRAHAFAAAAAPRAGADAAAVRIALLPGSRRREIERHWPVLLGAARLLAAALPSARFVTTAAEPVEMELPLERAADGLSALHGATLALAASGTVTLEAAALGVPCVVGYRVSPATWTAARALVGVPFVSLPNLLAGHALLPELLQDDFTPAAVAAAARRLLAPDPSLAASLADVAARARGPDGGPGAAVGALLRAVARR